MPEQAKTAEEKWAVDDELCKDAEKQERNNSESKMQIYCKSPTFDGHNSIRMGKRNFHDAASHQTRFKVGYRASFEGLELPEWSQAIWRAKKADQHLDDTAEKLIAKKFCWSIAGFEKGLRSPSF